MDAAQQLIMSVCVCDVGYCNGIWNYFNLRSYFYLLRMCFIITHSLQSVCRHDPHPINNTRRHFVVTGVRPGRGPGYTASQAQRVSDENIQFYSLIVLSNICEDENQAPNLNPSFICQSDLSNIHIFNFQSDTRRYQNNNAVGLQYTVTNTQGIVFFLSVDHVTRETRCLSSLYNIFILFFWTYGLEDAHCFGI